MSTERITILGSTGSVGTQALDVARHEHIRVQAIAAGSNVTLLEQQIRLFRPDICAVKDIAAAEDLKIRIADTGTKIISGDDSAEYAAAYGEGTVINAIGGIAGLRPTIACINSGHTLALANKESLVTAGDLVMNLAREKNVKINPVDSEHSAIAQCLAGNNRESLKKIILTCSGGPFFGKKRSELINITPQAALCHPTWNMGAKISIDSATLMNKGFEVIEAAHLFNISSKHIIDSVEVIIHRESIIHSMVEYCDGSVMAQLSTPDMRLPVMYALGGVNRMVGEVKPLDFKKLSSLSFHEPDFDTFILLGAAYRAFFSGGIVPAALNGANERAVELFLKSKISFTDIFDSVSAAVDYFSKSNIQSPTLCDIENTDKISRDFVDDYLKVLDANLYKKII